MCDMTHSYVFMSHVSHTPCTDQFGEFRGSLFCVLSCVAACCSSLQCIDAFQSGVFGGSLFCVV